MNFVSLYSVLAQIHHKDKNKNPQRVSNYTQYLNELNYAGLTFPLKLKHIEKFESLNPNISVNVLYEDAETKTIMPIRVTKHRGRTASCKSYSCCTRRVKN